MGGPSRGGDNIVASTSWGSDSSGRVFANVQISPVILPEHDEPGIARILELSAQVRLTGMRSMSERVIQPDRGFIAWGADRSWHSFMIATASISRPPNDGPPNDGPNDGRLRIGVSGGINAKHSCYSVRYVYSLSAFS